MKVLVIGSDGQLGLEFQKISNSYSSLSCFFSTIKTLDLLRLDIIDSSKFKNELGLEPSLQFEEGIKKTVNWYLENKKWIERVTSGDYQEYYKKMYK
tara:strand:+ start:205 stop:495 length:291 start_codon:yes stop_codon:yes gene_type:complete